MVIMKFRNSSEHEDLLKKVKKMKTFTEDLEEMLEECVEESEPEYRGGYRKSYDDEDTRMEGRYGYRRMGRR